MIMVVIVSRDGPRVRSAESSNGAKLSLLPPMQVIILRRPGDTGNAGDNN